MTDDEKRIWNKAISAAIMAFLNDEWVREGEFALRAIRGLYR